MNRRFHPRAKLATRASTRNAEAITRLAPSPVAAPSPEARSLRPIEEAVPRAEPVALRRSTPPRRDTRSRCERCALRSDCGHVREDGGECPLERDTFVELTEPERLPRVLRDVLRAELRTFFRAKRLEARTGGKIDTEAGKLAQSLFKQVECYLDICQRVGGPAGARGASPAAPSELYPNLEAALRASHEGLFSEVPDPAQREALRSRYVETLRQEDALLREVQGAVGE